MQKSGGNISTKPAKCKDFFRGGGRGHPPAHVMNDASDPGPATFVRVVKNSLFLLRQRDFRVASFAGISVYCRNFSRIDHPAVAWATCQVPHELRCKDVRGTS